MEQSPDRSQSKKDSEEDSGPQQHSRYSIHPDSDVEYYDERDSQRRFSYAEDPTTSRLDILAPYL